MSRLVLVDRAGGSLAALGAAIARVEGAPGFEEAVARTVGEPDVAPVVSEVLSEVGVLLVPTVKTFGELVEGDVVVAIGEGEVAGAIARFPAALAASGAPDLVVRSSARIARDHLARSLSAFCAERGKA